MHAGLSRTGCEQELERLPATEWGHVAPPTAILMPLLTGAQAPRESPFHIHIC